MRTLPSPLAIGLSAFALGCGVELDSNAVDELLVSALSGEEDSVSGESGARMAASDETAAGDRRAPPPLFRECDAEGSFVGFMDAYDEDRSGELEELEAAEVQAEHAGPRGGPREHFLHLLRVVYDSDISGDFEDAELEMIFEDFTVRCEAIHTEILAEHDSDGDGTLSEAEQELAREAHHARVEAERAEQEACRPERSGERPERPAEGEVPFGPLEAEFDADGSGDLTDDELATLRETLRERLRTGARPQPECEA